MLNLWECSILLDPQNVELKFLPEGPYPIDDRSFSWVAIQHGRESKLGSLNIFDVPSKTNRTYPLPGRPGFAFPTKKPNQFVVGCERSIGLFDTATSKFTTLAENIDADRENTIINDAVCADDVLVFGTKDLEFKTKKAGLYLYRGRDSYLTRLRDDQICSNGKVLVRKSDAIFWLYDIDTPSKQVVRYELNSQTGKLSEPDVCLDLTCLPFFPDGMIMTPDQEGLIISFYNPEPAAFGETRWYRLSDGVHLGTWLTPQSPQATCPQLIYHEGTIRMVITTAVEFMSDENLKRCPHAGKLFWGETSFDQTNESPKFLVEELI